MTRKDFLTAAWGRLSFLVMGMFVVASCGGGNGGGSTTPPPPAANNTVALSVNFGPNGQAGRYYNGIFTSVTVCAPGSTSNCQTVDHVLVDTGSYGLRVLNSALSTVGGSLGKIQDNNQNQLQECIQYGDSSFVWGPVMLADVQIAGEKAASVPIHVIGGNTFAVPSLCLATPISPGTPNGGNDDRVEMLGANGVLGLGNYGTDCGSACSPANIPAGSTFSGYPYYICPTGQACEQVGVPTGTQVWNPVALFSSADFNGVTITLGSVPAAGAASVDGTIHFGVGTQSNNALGSATLYALDAYGNFANVGYNGINYSSGGFLDTGSNALYVLDATTLGIADCTGTEAGYYCPNSTLTLSNIALTGSGNVGSGTVSLSIANASMLFAANPTFAAFNNLAGDSGTSPATDYFDFGLPFFLGRTVFVGIAGAAAPNGVSVPNGYVAF